MEKEFFMGGTGGVKGIIQLEQPLNVNKFDWALQHLGCNALITDDGPVTMTVLAYSTAKEYNKNLKRLMYPDGDAVIFVNLDKSEVV